MTLDNKTKDLKAEFIKLGGRKGMVELLELILGSLCRLNQRREWLEKKAALAEKQPAKGVKL